MAAASTTVRGASDRVPVSRSGVVSDVASAGDAASKPPPSPDAVLLELSELQAATQESVATSVHAVFRNAG
jgi:hypothetical protein